MQSNGMHFPPYMDFSESLWYHFATEWYYVWEGLVPSKRNLIEKMNSFGAKVGASRFGTVHFSPLPLNYIASQQHFAFNR